MPTYHLRLFVAGDGPKVARLIHDLTDLCETAIGSDNYVLEVIDVLDNPEPAEQSHFLATPTLIRDFPKPRLYLFGDLSHRQTLVDALGFPPTSAGTKSASTQDAKL